MVPSTSLMSPPCARTSSAAIARPRPDPPVRFELWNASNRCARACAGDAGAGVGHFDHHHRAFAPAGDADLVAVGIARFAALQRLHGIARQVEQHAEQLVRIGVDHQAALDRADPADRPVGLEPERLAHLLDAAARARSCGGRAAPPARAHRTASIRRTRSARSSARMSLGAKRCTCGSGRRTSRSEKSCAVVSRLRRS